MDVDFLDKILDDSHLQVSGNAYARYFWYGIALVIAIAGNSPPNEVHHFPS